MKGGILGFDYAKQQASRVARVVGLSNLVPVFWDTNTGQFVVDINVTGGKLFKARGNDGKGLLDSMNAEIGQGTQGVRGQFASTKAVGKMAATFRDPLSEEKKRAFQVSAGPLAGRQAAAAAKRKTYKNAASPPQTTGVVPSAPGQQVQQVQQVAKVQGGLLQGLWPLGRSTRRNRQNRRSTRRNRRT
jgi:hypothetical protein